jgi:hypothetical protein
VGGKRKLSMFQLFGTVIKSAVPSFVSDLFRRIFDFVMKAVGCPPDSGQGLLQVILEKTKAIVGQRAGKEKNCRDNEDGIKKVQKYLQGRDQHCIIV